MQHGLRYPWLFETEPGKHALLCSMPGPSLEAQWLSGEEIENPFAQDNELFEIEGLGDRNVIRKGLGGFSEEQKLGAVALARQSSSDGRIVIDLRIPIEGVPNRYSRSCLLLSWDANEGFQCHFAQYGAQGTLLPDGRLIAMNGGGGFFLFDPKDSSTRFYGFSRDLVGYDNTDWSRMSANSVVYNEISTWTLVPMDDRLIIGKSVDPALSVNRSGLVDVDVMIRDAHLHGARQKSDENMIWLLSDLNVASGWLHQPVRTSVPFCDGGYASPAGIWFDARSALWLLDRDSFGVIARHDWASVAVPKNGQPLCSPFGDNCFVTARQSQRIPGQYELLVVEAS